jgi:UDP-N-acetylmuramoylalanine--D-glutamate ligase
MMTRLMEKKSLTPQELKEMKVLVVGLARSGIAASRVLAELGSRVRATDLKTDLPVAEAEELRATGVELELGKNSIEFARDSDLLVLSPGVPLDSPLVTWAHNQARMVISEVELAYCLSQARFVAVTGTNGKSTTVSLLGRILKEGSPRVRVGGNIGHPVSALAPGLGEEWIMVIEISSFQLDTCISFRPAVSVLLNITPDHLDRYPSYQAYIQSKARLFARQTEEDIAIINYDDPDSMQASGPARCRKLFFSIRQEVEQGAFLRGEQVVARVGGNETIIFLTNDLRIRGPHNLANSLAASLAATVLGFGPDVIRPGLAGFHGLEHRLEFVDTIAGIDFINDSKATNVDALRCALEAVDPPIILVAGGKDKGADFSAVAGLVGERAKVVYLIGEARHKIERAFSGVAKVLTAGSLDQVVREAFGSASAGDTVLLAPGCASFDMFKDFEHRGSEFKRVVGELRQQYQAGGNE